MRRKTEPQRTRRRQTNLMHASRTPVIHLGDGARGCVATYLAERATDNRAEAKKEATAMIDESTLAVVRALARGIDPSTGEMLPSDHLCQQPATIRALVAALAELEGRSAGTRSPRNAMSGAKAGTAWDPADDEALAQAFDRGEPVGKLAQEFQRSRGAINARLVRLGKIETPPGLRLRGTAQELQPPRIE